MIDGNFWVGFLATIVGAEANLCADVDVGIFSGGEIRGGRREAGGGEGEDKGDDSVGLHGCLRKCGIWLRWELKLW